jgi:poly-gamma-glutamate synthesis protein (capsule biosynthesis protein)
MYEEAVMADSHDADPTPGAVRLALAGDVMTGRGIDQILRRPGDDRLYERYVSSATTYVELAERASGAIPRGAGDSYVWGDLPKILDRSAPDAFIVNLETAVTHASDPADKGVNYRMSPDNVAALAAGGIDCCVLANNHVLDWGRSGLAETLAALDGLGMAAAGAGVDRAAAAAPAALPHRHGGRTLVFAYGCEDSGVPPSWAAGPDHAGVSFLTDLSDAAAARVAEDVAAAKQSGDIVVASIHWGANWGYDIPDAHRRFARRLIDAAGVDVVHGHSSHHRKAVEVHDGKLILYGCGDFLNDYEGISGRESYRGELVLLYVPELRARDGVLERLVMVPFRIRRFRLQRASPSETEWLRGVMDREARRFGGRVGADSAAELVLG